jgi:hypothetical protein
LTKSVNGKVVKTAFVVMVTSHFGVYVLGFM